MTDVSIEEQRKNVSELLFLLLEKKICAREFMENFPVYATDPSLQCAWHAAIHLEADEDIRSIDSEYMAQQDEYLEKIANTLKKAEALPENMLQEYNKLHEPIIKTESKTFIQKLKGILRIINL